MRAADDDPPTPIFVFEDARQPQLTSWQVCCLTINVISATARTRARSPLHARSHQFFASTVVSAVGSGFLSVPAGFLEAGVLLGPAVLAAVSVLQWAAAAQLAQVASRAHALLQAKDAATTLTPTLAPYSRSLKEGLLSSSPALAQMRPPSLTLPSHTSYEIMMLTRLYLGKWAERMNMVAASLYMVGCLWSFISVFASALAATVPLPWLEVGEPCDIYKTDVYGGGCTLYFWWVLTFAM